MRFTGMRGFIAALALIMALVAGCGGKPAGTEIKFDTIEQGQFSQITEQKAVLVSDQQAWEQLWAEHGADGGPVAVQFQDEVILAVYLGEQGSGGHTVTVTDVRVDGKTVHVAVQHTKPGGDSMTIGAMTQPFHIVKLAQVPEGVELKVNWK